MRRWHVAAAAAVGEVLSQPYYSVHLLTLLSYFVLRAFTLPTVSPLSEPTFLRWESQAGLSLLLVLTLKFAKSNTLDGFIGDALLYGRCLLALLVAILDPRLLPWYLFAFVGSFLLWHQPNYSGSDDVVRLTPLQLETQLLNNRTTTWVVEFVAAWSPHCNHFRRTLAKLSLKYSSETLHFGTIDVGCYPKVASKYGINFGVIQRQLPTLVLFEGGLEVARLPRSAFDGGSNITESMVVQHFELDLHLIQALSHKAGPVLGESLGK